MQKCLAQGFTNKQIASSLYISGGTVKNYVSNLYSKIGISDRTSAAIYIKDLLNGVDINLKSNRGHIICDHGYFYITPIISIIIL